MDYILDFTDGSYVGKVSVYKTEKQFLEAVKNEYAVDVDCVEPTQVKRRYVRWYPKPPYDGLQDEFPDGCYSFYKPGRGAFECFVLEG